MKLTISVLFIAGIAGIATAQHDGDIYLTQRDNRLATGMIDALTGEITVPVFVFGADFDSSHFTNEPGLDGPEGSFPPGARIGFNIRKAVRVWNGSAFESIPEERIQVRLGPLGPVLSPLTDTPTAGFGMLANSIGEFHQHPGFTLVSPARDGVYLLELELWTDIPGVGGSEPYWMVFANNAPPETHDAAMEWVYLRHVCPADLNLDGDADFNDYLEFLNLYNANSLRVDYNDDGTVDFNDYLEFLNRLNAGCPR